LVSAIEAVLDNPNMASSLVAAGDERLTHFSWDRSTDELVALFELACAARA
jgi:glycosyltransferase involved in cell wall biosynthesis